MKDSASEGTEQVISQRHIIFLILILYAPTYVAGKVSVARNDCQAFLQASSDPGTKKMIYFVAKMFLKAHFLVDTVNFLISY